MEFKVIRSKSIEALNEKIKSMIEEGWKPVGSHQVVTTSSVNRYSGMQHKDTQYDSEYSISMIKE